MSHCRNTRLSRANQPGSHLYLELESSRREIVSYIDDLFPSIPPRQEVVPDYKYTHLFPKPQPLILHEEAHRIILHRFHKVQSNSPFRRIITWIVLYDGEQIIQCQKKYAHDDNSYESDDPAMDLIAAHVKSLFDYKNYQDHGSLVRKRDTKLSRFCLRRLTQSSANANEDYHIECTYKIHNLCADLLAHMDALQIDPVVRDWQSFKDIMCAFAAKAGIRLVFSDNPSPPIPSEPSPPTAPPLLPPPMPPPQPCSDNDDIISLSSDSEVECCSQENDGIISEASTSENVRNLMHERGSFSTTFVSSLPQFNQSNSKDVRHIRRVLRNKKSLPDLVLTCCGTP